MPSRRSAPIRDSCLTPSVQSKPVDRSALTPAQLDVVDDLLALGQARPTFHEGLALQLLDVLEDGLEPVLQLLGPVELTVNKTALNQVHACEAHHLAESDVPFEWTVASTRGTVAHRARELAVFHPKGDQVSPLELVDEALNRLIQTGDDWTPRDFLRGADPAELAEVRGGACDVVTKFQECFPPLVATWRPRLEWTCRGESAGRAID